MHEAAKGPPLSTGMAPPQSSKHSNRCTRHRRVHQFRLELAPPQSSKHSIRCTRHRRIHHFRLELAPSQSSTQSTDFKLKIHMRTRPRRSHHFIKWLLQYPLHNHIETQSLCEDKASKIPPLCKWLPLLSII